MLALYYLTSCPYCLRARLTLAEKQLPFSRRVVGKEKPPELEELSGGKVPVLVEDSLVVRDSTVIVEYLEERSPTPALFPQGARERAIVRMTMNDIESRLMKPLEQIVHGRALDEAARREVSEGFASFASSMGDAGLFLGMSFSFADIWLLAAWELAGLVGYDHSASGPKLTRWYERMRERDSVKTERLTKDT